MLELRRQLQRRGEFPRQKAARWIGLLTVGEDVLLDLKLRLQTVYQMKHGGVDWTLPNWEDGLARPSIWRTCAQAGTKGIGFDSPREFSILD